MANVSGNATIWDALNYFGDLFTADTIETPFLSMIGGLTGGEQTNNFEFAVDQTYSHEALGQKSVTETQARTAPAAITHVKVQEKNVTQIFHEAVNVSYVQMSNEGRLSGLNTANKSKMPAISRKDEEIALTLEQIARLVEWHFINGVYQISNGPTVANQTRGMLDLCAAKTTIAAAGADLDDAMVDALLLAMFNAGAQFRNCVIFCGGIQKQKLSKAYGYAPEDRNVGGVNIKQLETDFGNIGIAPAHKMMPAGTILCADMAVIKPVTQPVPGKGNLFYEELSRTGAAETGQIFGQIGLNHGPSFAHGTITGLKTT